MQSACDTGEVLALLECGGWEVGGGGSGGAAEGAGAGAAGVLLGMYGAVREPWLTRGLLQYHARTGSARALDVLARAPDPHARLLLDALADELTAPPPRPPRALAALAALLARRPPWLHRLHAHPALRAVLRAARSPASPAASPAPRLHALLALAALVQHAPPAPASPLVPELAEALVRAAAAPEPHVQLAAHALFHELYAAAPLALLEALRGECAARGRVGERARAVLPALVEAARLHPQLVLGVGATAGTPHERRWTREESAGGGGGTPALPSPAPPSPAPAGSAGAVSRAASALRPPAEPWFALHERCGADSAPHTPLPPEAAGGSEGGSPPEAAVEATPENTPAKEARAHFTFPTESSSVRALGRLSQPPSPLRKETSPGCEAGGGSGGGGGGGYAGRLARVVLDRDRAQAESASPAPLPRPSPVPFGGAPPPAVARPEPRGPQHDEPLNVEDREVLELTSRGEETWPAGGGGGGGGSRAGGAGSEALPVRCLLAAVSPPAPRGRPRPAATRASPPPRRPASCPPRARVARHDVAVQTVETAPEPYEFIISDYFAHVTDKQVSEEWSVRPNARLDAYLQALYAGRGAEAGAGAGAGAGEAGAAPGDLAGVLALTHAALQYERWRREAHAERCRRLLGRCRQARALELNNAALRDRARALQAELEATRARAARPAPAAAAPALALAAGDEHAARLEAQLAAERVARERAEAQLKETEAQCATQLAALQAWQGAGWEAARREERLARVGGVAERRAGLVRRMRRELLLLAERDHALAQLQTQTGAGGHGAAAEEAAAGRVRAAREEATAARAEAEAATARAEALAARLQEAEAAAAGREQACSELRRAARRVAGEHTARLAALQDKYRASLHVQRRLEARRLEVLAGPAPSSGAVAGPGAVATPATLAGPALALADCSRVRHLLEDDVADHL